MYDKDEMKTAFIQSFNLNFESVLEFTSFTITSSINKLLRSKMKSGLKNTNKPLKLY